MSPGVRRLVSLDARQKAASAGYRPESQHPEWTPAAFSRLELVKEALSCLELAEEKLWCQVLKREAVLHPEWTPEAVSRPGLQPVDLAALAQQAADLAS